MWRREKEREREIVAGRRNLASNGVSAGVDDDVRGKYKSTGCHKSNATLTFELKRTISAFLYYPLRILIFMYVI